MTPVVLLPKVRSARIMDAMQFMPCSLRVGLILGVPCAPQSTVVGCHLDTPGKGMSTKSTDLGAAAGCLICHNILDRVDPRWQIIARQYPGAFYHRLLQGLIETQARLVEQGVLTAIDGELL